ncbi:MAG: TIGR03985 family CRISPR-associated protein [Microcoleaceae cyanobacterium]
MASYFAYAPTPEVLQWLAAGRLASRLQRSIRLWVLLNCFYSSEINWAKDLPQPFNYSDVRDRLFASTHPMSDRLSAEQIIAYCSDPVCLCHRSGQDCIETSISQHEMATWQQEVKRLTAWNPRELAQQLQEYPFATVHRTIRDDLKHLEKMGWLQKVKAGSYLCCAESAWPQLAATSECVSGLPTLSEVQMGQLLQVLESASFVQPSLTEVVLVLRKQLQAGQPLLQTSQSTQSRIFIHLNSILASRVQNRIDSYQRQLEALWQTPDGGVIQFDSWIPQEERRIKLTVYPVCLHYAQQAKYLSAYGTDPYGQFGWHNYRLDRIISEQLTVLNWDNAKTPSDLKKLWQQKKLPSVAEVDTKLREAWGLNFYLSKDLLILRFGAGFARWYINDTEHHPTFKLIQYKDLPQLIQQEGKLEEQAELLKRIKACSPKDFYYRAWVRHGDMSVLIQLRSWRSQGEVIAPFSLRKKVREEARQELSNY